MPESTAPANPPYVNLNDGPFLYDSKPLPVDPALQAVVQTFQDYETQRNTNYDGRWMECDALYNGTVQQRYWEGSKIPKASVPNNIAFDHVEAALGFIESALFDIPEWFGCEALQETNPQEARDVQALYEQALSEPYDDLSSAISEMRIAIKSGLQYGTGMMMMEWDGRRPVFSALDLRDVYVDYGLKSSFIDRARSVIIRQRVTVDDLKRMAEDPRVNLPPPAVLWFMAKNPTPAMADTYQQQRELLRGALATSVDDSLPIPAQNTIEVLRYHDRGRIVWVLNRVHVMLSIPNPYAPYIPIVSFPCRPQIGRFYGMSFPEAIRFQQRVTEGLGNAHLNEVHLAIDPPINAPVSGKSEPWFTYPGATRFVSSPKDVIAQQTPNATKDVINEITYYEQMAERRNGVSSLAQGAARAGNINRTRAGVQAQSEGTNIRLKHVIENIRDYMIIPMLHKMRKFYQVHTTPDQVLMTADDNGQQRLITAAVFHKPVKMIMDAASRMITRDRLGQNLPTVMQYLINGSVMQGLSGIGLTIDFEQVAQTVQDAAGLPRRYQWIRPMTDQEKQQLNQPPPEAIMQQQMKQQDLQMRDKATTLKHQSEMAGHQAEIQKAIIAKQTDPMEAQMKQAEMQAKLQFQDQSNQQKMAAKQMEIEMKARADQQKLEADRAKLQADVQAKQVEGQAKVQQHVMSLQMQREQAEETRRQMLIDRQMGTQKNAGTNNSADR